MGKLIKALVFLIILGFLGLIGFAYLGDLTPQQEPQSRAVTLDLN